MKVLLINPPNFHQVRVPGSNQLANLLHDCAPPMGLMYLQSFLRSESDHEVKLWNAQTLARPGLKALDQILDRYRPDLVGITVMMLNWYDALDTARLVRNKLPSAHIVLGGPYISVYPEETLIQPEIDSVVIGEGEHSFLELAKRVSRNEPLEGAQGVWYKENGSIVRNPRRPIEINPDRFPFPDRSDFDPLQHRLATNRLAPSAVIISSRGCPFACTFCANHDRHYRERTPENIVAEVISCKNQGYRSLDFYDDIFNITKQRVMEICDTLLKHKVNLPWSCRCRVGEVDEEMISRMAQSGCTRISFGIESASPKILEQIRKHITPEQSVTAINLCRKYKIATLGYYIVGFPGETMEQINDTIKLAFKLNCDFPIFYTLMPEPGSEIYGQAIKDPNFGGDYYRQYTRNPQKQFTLKLWETAVTEKQLLRLIGRAYLRYYFRFSYLFNSARKLNSFEDLKAKTVAALKMGRFLLSERGHSPIRNAW